MNVSDLPDRLAMKIEVADSECWNWIAGRNDKGYGKIQWQGANRLAHRITYLLLIGPLPDGLEADHLCRNRGCVNPTHIEFVTHFENSARGVGVGAINAAKTHCKHGHEFTAENTLPRRHIHGRQCRACLAAKSARRWRERRP